MILLARVVGEVHLTAHSSTHLTSLRWATFALQSEDAVETLGQLVVLFLAVPIGWVKSQTIGTTQRCLAAGRWLRPEGLKSYPLMSRITPFAKCVIPPGPT